MISAQLVKDLENSRQFFDRSTGALTEADSSYAPVEGVYTVAGHVAAVADAIEWFIDGTFNGAGFDMDFEKHDKAIRSVTSLSKARGRLAGAFARALQVVGSMSDEELTEFSPEDDPVLPGVPRGPAMISGILDHTAHHRGALTVYARLLGKTPPMPYM